MALTMALADAALKEDYQPALREQLNNKSVLLSQIEMNSKDVEGRRAVLSLHVGRNSGVGARAEGGTLPTAGQQGYAESRVTLKHNYGRIQLNGQTIRAMKSDNGSFVRAIDSETKGVVRDLRQEVNRQCYNTAAQRIATCGTTSGAAEIQLASDTTQTQMRHLAIGTVIDVGTAGDADSVAASLTITAVNTSTLTITTATSVTTSSSHFISIAGSAGYQLTGLREIVLGSGTLFNINPTTNPVWVSTANGNSGTNRAATDNLFETVINDIQIASDEDPNLIMTSYGVARNYAAQLKSQKRYDKTNDLKGGFKGLSVSTGNVELTLATDKDCPENTAFVLNTDHLCQNQMSDWEFMDEDGSVLSRVSGVDAYEATLFKYHELTTDMRNSHGIITDLTES
jgi:hypothetical protein